MDGRQQSSLGMTQTEAANLMIELGAYNALNLDGGGSTTMAVRKPGSENIEIINSPSDGSPRRISNAIGIFSTFPPYPLEGFIIDTVDTNILSLIHIFYTCIWTVKNVNFLSNKFFCTH